MFFDDRQRLSYC
jgi:hypothetical protein